MYLSLMASYVPICLMIKKPIGVPKKRAKTMILAILGSKIPSETELI